MSADCFYCGEEGVGKCECGAAYCGKVSVGECGEIPVWGSLLWQGECGWVWVSVRQCQWGAGYWRKVSVGQCETVWDSVLPGPVSACRCLFSTCLPFILARRTLPYHTFILPRSTTPYHTILSFLPRSTMPYYTIILVHEFHTILSSLPRSTWPFTDQEAIASPSGSVYPTGNCSLEVMQCNTLWLNFMILSQFGCYFFNQ